MGLWGRGKVTGTIGEEESEEDLFSDESSFYGDVDTKTEFEERVFAFDPTVFWASHERDIQFIAEQGRQVKEDMDLSHKTSPAIKKEDGEKRSMKLFRSAKNLRPGTPMEIDTPTACTEPFNPYEGDGMAKQLHETVDDFLNRLPPSTTSVSSGPWIWVANPFSPRPRQRSDVASLKEAGSKLLEELRNRRLKYESKYPGKEQGAVTRAMKADRAWLEQSMVGLAKKTNVTSGKWMLFPSPAHVDNVWRKVVKATSEGILGCSAKVATDDGSERARLICVYTEDFTNRDDVKRVLKKMEELGLVKSGQDGQGIYYKCDAYTWLDIINGNEYKIKASLYGSMELFRQMGQS